MKNNAADIEILFGKAQDCGKTSIELLKLQAIEKCSKIFSVLASNVVILLIVALFTLCLNLGVAFWIGEMLGKIYYGFFIVSGFYLMVAVIVYSFKKLWIEDPIRNSIIDNLMEKTIS